MTDRVAEGLTNFLYFLGLANLGGAVTSVAFYDSMLGLMLFIIASLVSFGLMVLTIVFWEGKHVEDR